jgi:hypothetical protein
MKFQKNVPIKLALFLSLIKFVIEKFSKTSDYSFPFVKANIHMVKYLCSVLNIGEKSNCFREKELMHDGEGPKILTTQL